jgi:hypothetical protein
MTKLQTYNKRKGITNKYRDKNVNFLPECILISFHDQHLNMSGEFRFQDIMNLSFDISKHACQTCVSDNDWILSRLQQQRILMSQKIKSRIN